MKSRFNEMYESFKTNVLLEEAVKPTKEMTDWFEERTRKHIERDQNNWRKLYGTKFEKYLDELPDKEKHILKHEIGRAHV